MADAWGGVLQGSLESACSAVSLYCTVVSSRSGQPRGRGFEPPEEEKGQGVTTSAPSVVRMGRQSFKMVPPRCLAARSCRAGWASIGHPSWIGLCTTAADFSLSRFCATSTCLHQPPVAAYVTHGQRYRQAGVLLEEEEAREKQRRRENQENKRASYVYGFTESRRGENSSCLFSGPSPALCVCHGGSSGSR